MTAVAQRVQSGSLNEIEAGARLDLDLRTVEKR